MNKETAVTAAPLSADEISAVLAAAGAIDEKTDFNIRMKTSGNNFVTDDDVWMTNIKSGEAAFTARLLAPPDQYQAMYFDQAAATLAGRPEMEKKFCKSYYNKPSEARNFGTNGAPCRPCPFNPYGDERPRCSWKGDLDFQIIPEDGTLVGDEPVYTISLSMTGMIEWKGTKSNPTGGSVTDKNFQFKLAELSLEMCGEWNVEGPEAITIGLSALAEGLVAAEFRSLTARNEERGNEWNVVSCTPVHIQRPETMPAIEAELSGSGAPGDDA